MSAIKQDFRADNIHIVGANETSPKREKFHYEHNIPKTD